MKARRRSKRTHPIEVYEVNLTKEKLAAMPANERRLLLLLGHAANEINADQKLIRWGLRRTSP